MAESSQARGNLKRVFSVIILLFLLQFFGCGLAVIVNIFVPFLKETAFAIIAIVLFTELLAVIVIGKCVQVISAMRKMRGQGATPADKTGQF